MRRPHKYIHMKHSVKNEVITHITPTLQALPWSPPTRLLLQVRDKKHTSLERFSLDTMKGESRGQGGQLALHNHLNDHLGAAQLWSGRGGAGRGEMGRSGGAASRLPSSHTQRTVTSLATAVLCLVSPAAAPRGAKPCPGPRQLSPGLSLPHKAKQPVHQTVPTANSTAPPQPRGRHHSHGHTQSGHSLDSPHTELKHQPLKATKGRH